MWHGVILGMTILKRHLTLAGLVLSVSIPHGWANSVDLPTNAPLPEPRPYAPVSGVAAAASLPFAAGVLVKDDIAALKEGLDALFNGNAARARQIRDELPERALDRRILTWAIATSNVAGVPSAEIAEAAITLSNWPGMEQRRVNSERALYHENPSSEAVIEAFDETYPLTYEGTRALARAHLALGDENAALAVLSPFWRIEKLSPGQEAAFLKAFGELIPPVVHRYRMERMLYEERIRSAERVASLAGGEALMKAWAAVIRNESDAGELLDAVPEAQRTAGYLFAKARYLRRAGKFEEAADVMLAAPREPEILVDPDEWWFERRVLSRELLDIDDPQTAYRIAADHSALSRGSIADAEFHAGWYALRALNDPEAAARHFARIERAAEGAISLSRAYYWLGRAAQAGAANDATDYYRRAATFGTTFYGQLAAAQLGRTAIATTDPEPTDDDRRTFAARDTVRAIRRLQEAGHERLADTLYLTLAEELPNAGELTLLAAMAEKHRSHYLALRIGKVAAQQGVDVGALTHPLGAIPASASISNTGKALAYAVARQESEFNVGARSSVGARGLLQLMPGTAQDMARKNGLPYSVSRLTADAAYNATLGATYLSEQLSRFDGSYILTFIGYNAGPGRALEWMERYGDPRGRPIEEVIDWIERIPFTETRSYVQRVMENYQVYKMRLTGRFDIVEDLTGGRESG